MKVIVFKSYVKKSTVYSDEEYFSSEDVWHRFNSLESVRDVTQEEFFELKKAIDYFNSKRKSSYVLCLVELVDDDNELNSLLSDFKSYKEKEDAKAEKIRQEYLAKKKYAEAKSEERKKARMIKKLSSEFNISKDEAIEILNRKK